jgi:hypothetical protein
LKRSDLILMGAVRIRSTAGTPKNRQKTVDPEKDRVYIQVCHPRGLIAQSGRVAPFCHFPASIIWSSGSSCWYSGALFLAVDRNECGHLSIVSDEYHQKFSDAVP